MKRFIHIVLLILVPVLVSAQNTPLSLSSDNLDEIVREMSLEEKVSILVGGEMGYASSDQMVGNISHTVPGACGTTHAISRLGIPSTVMADGPAGVRISPLREGDDATYYCTAFPIGTALASTWNTGIVRSIGMAMGEEAREYGIDIILAPALNIQRDPLCGRNFEYYSEDPLLSGKMAAAVVMGVQSQGVGTALKHFAVNNQETKRVANQANLSRRALYEIYLKGFEIAVKESAPWAVMTSYNYVNGVYASESHDLLETVLRQRWGFDGMVMTDWFGGDDPVRQMVAGNDLLMPGRLVQYERLLEAVRSGELGMDVVDRNVKRILSYVLKTNSFHGYSYSDTPDLDAHAEIALEAAKESVILLKNRQLALPLSVAGRRLALFGNTSYDYISGGTGSGDVNEAYTVSLYDGLKKRDFRIFRRLAACYRRYIRKESAKVVPDYENNPLYDFLCHPRIEEYAVSHRLLERSAKYNDAALITIGRNSGEHADRVVKDDFNLKECELEMIKEVCRAFHKRGKPVVVVLNVGGVVEMSSWKGLPDAILLAWHGGQEAGDAVASVLCGETNPSGHLPVTMPESYSQCPTAENFPYDHGADVQEILKNVLDVRGKTNEVKNVDYTDYEEDIYVGYRYYDTFDVRPAYAFGHGLSYTDFQYTGLLIERQGEDFIVSLYVRNTGSRKGKDVVQLYLSRPASDRPEKELVGFHKTRELLPGETEHVVFKIPYAGLACFDEKLNGMMIYPGTYAFHVGMSSDDIHLSGTVKACDSGVFAEYPDIFQSEKCLQRLKP